MGRFGRRFPRLSKALWGTTAATAAAATALSLPELQSVPAPLLPARVTLDGLGRMTRGCLLPVAMAYDYRAPYLTLPLLAAMSDAAWLPAPLRPPCPTDVAVAEAMREAHMASAGRVQRYLDRCGGLYIKTGQFCSSLSGLLPPEYLAAFKALQDGVRPRSRAEVEAALRNAFGRPLSEVFGRIDMDPVAAASMAQVHRATLLDGRDVAVKVQYLDVAQRVDGDIRSIALLMRMAAWVQPGVDAGLDEFLDAFRTAMAHELDFMGEGRNAERCEREAVAGGFERGLVAVPQVVWDLTRPTVLVTEFIDGAVKVNDIAGIRALGLDPVLVGRTLVDLWSYQTYFSGFLHSDPHAGNVFVRRRPQRYLTDPRYVAASSVAAPMEAGDVKASAAALLLDFFRMPFARFGDSTRRVANTAAEEVAEETLQLVVLDHGLYVELAPPERLAMARLWHASVMHDTPGVEAVCRDLGLATSAAAELASSFLLVPYDINATLAQASQTTTDAANSPQDASKAAMATGAPSHPHDHHDHHEREHGDHWLQRSVEDLSSQELEQLFAMSAETEVWDRIDPRYGYVLQNIYMTQGICYDLGCGKARPGRMLRAAKWRMTVPPALDVALDPANTAAVDEATALVQRGAAAVRAAAPSLPARLRDFVVTQYVLLRLWAMELLVRLFVAFATDAKPCSA